jgi:outer membrane lipoprotein carrier protein
MGNAKCWHRHHQEIDSLFFMRKTYGYLMLCLSLQAALFPSLVRADALADLSAALTTIETYQADFTQTIYDQHDKQVQQSSGSLYASRPGKLHWAIEQPFEQLIVVDGKHIWRYEADLEQVIVSDYDEDLGSTPALLLSGDVASIGASYQVARAKNHYTLLPKDNESLFRAMQVTLEDGRITRIKLSDSLDQTTMLKFEHIEVNPQLDASLFQFEPPEGVDILRDE